VKALLVWPKFESFSFWNFETVCTLAGVKYMTPPLGLLTTGALLPEEWDLRLVDENVSPLCDDDVDWADFVLVGAKIVHRQRALDIVRLARAAGKPVAVGGPDPTLNETVYLAAGADYLCLGEGELTVPQMVADFAAGVSEGVYRADGMADLTTTPVPRFDLIDFSDYLYIGIQFSRGCPYSCEFCNVIDLHASYRTKDVSQVIEELDTLYALGYRGQVDFFDDNLIGHMKGAKPFLKRLARWLEEHNYPFQFSTSVTLNIAKDIELLELLRAARFKYLLVGIETPSESALKTAQKPQNVGFSIPEAVDRIYRHAGATVHSGFLIGLDGEPDDIGRQITDCIDDTSIPWVMAGMVYPLPGTQLARRLDSEGRLFPRARSFDDERVRDQISAGLQFRPERPAVAVIDDLITVLRHSFDPKKYFARCADVATRINTVPKLIPGWRIFFRNARTFLRLCVRVTRRRTIRGPFWKAFWRVLFKNRVGMEALVTLAVLYTHFESMLPYCFEQLERQKLEIQNQGEDEWFSENLKETPPSIPALPELPAHQIPAPPP